ncbi:hypothetical protein CSUI_005488 [Cystoisospora suis]|uniref:Uncharacterized protein n=1 Tax=Cystoisospora suis TaxID=483139 RepID=A0A2C6KXF2_9APIC|nr:hypothetical protein CSUI_005488 [Cystoisospora suis]
MFPVSRTFLLSCTCSSTELCTGRCGLTLCPGCRGRRSKKQAHFLSGCYGTAKDTSIPMFSPVGLTRDRVPRAFGGRDKGDATSEVSPWTETTQWRPRVVPASTADSRKAYVGGSSRVTRQVLHYNTFGFFSRETPGIGVDAKYQMRTESRVATDTLCCTLGTPGGKRMFSFLTGDRVRPSDESKYRGQVYVYISRSFVGDVSVFSRIDNIRSRPHKAAYREQFRAMETLVQGEEHIRPAGTRLWDHISPSDGSNGNNATEFREGLHDSRKTMSASRCDDVLIRSSPVSSRHSKQMRSACLSGLTAPDGDRTPKARRDATVQSSWKPISTLERGEAYWDAHNTPREKAERRNKILQAGSRKGMVKEGGNRQEGLMGHNSSRGNGATCPSQAGDGSSEGRATQVLLRQLDLHAAVKRSNSVEQVLEVCSDFLERITKDLGNCCSSRQHSAEWNTQSIHRSRMSSPCSSRADSCPTFSSLSAADGVPCLPSNSPSAGPSLFLSSLASLGAAAPSSRDSVPGICSHVAADFGWINSAHVMHQLAVLSSSSARGRKSPDSSPQVKNVVGPGTVRGRETHSLTSGSEPAQSDPGADSETKRLDERVNCSVGQLALPRDGGTEAPTCGAKGTGLGSSPSLRGLCSEQAETQDGCLVQKKFTPGLGLLRDPRFLAVFQCALYHVRDIYNVAARRRDSSTKPGDRQGAFRTQEVHWAGLPTMYRVSDSRRVSAGFRRQGRNSRTSSRQAHEGVSTFSSQLAVLVDSDKTTHAGFRSATSHQRHAVSREAAALFPSETRHPVKPTGLSRLQQTVRLSELRESREKGLGRSESLPRTLGLGKASMAAPSWSTAPRSAFSRALTAVRGPAPSSRNNRITELGECEPETVDTSTFDLFRTKIDVSPVGRGNRQPDEDNREDIPRGSSSPCCRAEDKHTGGEGERGGLQGTSSASVSPADAGPEVSTRTVQGNDLTMQQCTSRHGAQEIERAPTPAQLRFLSSICWAVGKLRLMTAAFGNGERCKPVGAPRCPAVVRSRPKGRVTEYTNRFLRAGPKTLSGVTKDVQNDLVGHSSSCVPDQHFEAAADPDRTGEAASAGTTERPGVERCSSAPSLLAASHRRRSAGAGNERGCNSSGFAHVGTGKTVSAFAGDPAINGRGVPVPFAGVHVFDGRAGLGPSLCREMLCLLETSVAMCLDLFDPRQVALSLWGLAQCHGASACTLSIGNDSQPLQGCNGRLLSEYWSHAAGAVHRRLTELSLRELSVFAHTCCAVGYRDEALMKSIGSRMLELLPTSWDQRRGHVPQAWREDITTTVPSMGREGSCSPPEPSRSPVYGTRTVLSRRPQKMRRWVSTWRESSDAEAKTPEPTGRAFVDGHSVGVEGDSGAESLGGSVSILLSAFAALGVPLTSCFGAVAVLLLEDRVPVRQAIGLHHREARRGHTSGRCREMPRAPAASSGGCRTDAEATQAGWDARALGESQGFSWSCVGKTPIKGCGWESVPFCEPSSNDAGSGKQALDACHEGAGRPGMGSFLGSLKPVEATALAWAFATFYVGEQCEVRQHRGGEPSQNKGYGADFRKTEKTTLLSQGHDTSYREHTSNCTGIKTSPQVHELVGASTKCGDQRRNARSVVILNGKLATPSCSFCARKLRERPSAEDPARLVSDCDRRLIFRVLQSLAMHAVSNDRQYCLVEQVRFCWALTLQDLYVPSLLLSVLHSLHQREVMSPKRAVPLFLSSPDSKPSEADNVQKRLLVKNIMAGCEASQFSRAASATKIEGPAQQTILKAEPYDGLVLPAMLQTQFYFCLLSYLTRRDNTSLIRWPGCERARGVLAAKRRASSQEHRTRLQPWRHAGIRGSWGRGRQEAGPSGMTEDTTARLDKNVNCSKANRAGKDQTLSWAYSDIENFVSYMDAARTRPSLLPNSFFRCRASLDRHPDRSSRSTLSQLHIRVLIVLRKVLQTEWERRQHPTRALIREYGDGLRTTRAAFTSRKHEQVPGLSTAWQVTLEHRDVTGISIDLVAWPPAVLGTDRTTGDDRLSAVQKPGG